MVEVNFGFLCLNPRQDEHGHYTVEGIGLRGGPSRKVPAHHPGLAGIIELKFTAAETGLKKLGFHIMDLDGNAVVEFEDVELMVEPPIRGESYSFYPVEFPLSEVQFPEFGEYTMIFRVDGVDKHRMSYRLRQKEGD